MTNSPELCDMLCMKTEGILILLKIACVRVVDHDMHAHAETAHDAGSHVDALWRHRA